MLWIIGKMMFLSEQVALKGNKLYLVKNEEIPRDALLRKVTDMKLEELKKKYYGEVGSEKRDKLEDGYKNFKIGVLLKEARLKSGLTQQELADKVGTTKSYISKIENDVKEARISTLKKIVEMGFGGILELNIKLN